MKDIILLFNIIAKHFMSVKGKTFKQKLKAIFIKLLSGLVMALIIYLCVKALTNGMGLSEVLIKFK